MTNKTELVKQWALATHLLFAKDDSQSHKIIHHIESIGQILIRAGVPYEGDVMRAAYLHDILEDTPMDYELIWCFFDKDVSDLVYNLTDDTEGSRKERQTNTYRRIAKNEEAITIKLADRISNIEYTLWGLQNTHYDHMGGRIDRSPTPEETKTAMKKAKMYLKEYAFFKEKLRYEASNTATYTYILWVQLDNLMDFLGEVMEND